jgi:hypothetical protein
MLSFATSIKILQTSIQQSLNLQEHANLDLSHAQRTEGAEEVTAPTGTEPGEGGRTRRDEEQAGR